MRKPKPFDSGCVPAEANRLSSEEYQQMIDHAEDCATCHKGREEFSVSLKQSTPEERGAENAVLWRHIKKGGLGERFLKRARAAGIQFSPAVNFSPEAEGRTEHRMLHTYVWVGAAAALTIIVAGTGYRALYPTAEHASQTAVQVPRRMTQPVPSNQTYALEEKVRELQATVEASETSISKLRAENAEVHARISALEKDLEAGQGEKQTLQKAIAAEGDLNAQLVSQNDRNDMLLARTKAELEESQARVAEMQAEVGIEKAELSTVTQQLKLQTASLNRERDLLAAGRDITDLMGARNLHIIDVHDADGKGKNRKSFGRIFYTEGKSLIFYAYDLDDKKFAQANYSFDVWGERLGEPTSIRSLGILYTDDREQKRWTLKVNDPQQLAEIDSVFVTVEPHETAAKPSGQKILFAFLGGNANHP
jgi:hypothetical protein